MSTHTPGPWDVVRHSHIDGELWLSVNAGEPGGMRPWIAEIKYLTTDDVEQWANARLIAAAPELLEALRDVLMVIEADDLVPESVSYMRRARAAIAKAEGETR